MDSPSIVPRDDEDFLGRVVLAVERFRKNVGAGQVTFAFGVEAPESF